MILRATYYGSPHLGIFVACNEEFAVVPKNIPSHFEKLIRENLEADIIKTNISNTSLIGVLTKLNSKKMFVPDIINRDELKILNNHIPEVIVLNGKYNAIGNLLCMNDHGAVCSKSIESEVKKYIKVSAMGVAGTEFIGSAVYCNNNGLLAHRNCTDEEIEALEKHLGVKGDVGTVNFGDPFVSTGIFGNSEGIVVGEFTSGPELNRIDDVFIPNKKKEL